MAKKVTVDLDQRAMWDFLRSEPVEAACLAKAQEIQKRLGEGYEVDSYVGRGRVNAQVKAVSEEALTDCYQNNALLKAVKR